ncbi:helix-turn-helix transcriptional regulator [Paenibacillus sp. SN-8-1]|uniref:helix-turn-helix transcriptional regulator n=1 Tax=Paenibacillus sp. SN-8-1 TaxID=3435409 RepID=UPI003D9A420B
MSEFKNKLKALRTERDLTISDIAKLLGVSERTVQYYEKGERQPTLEGLMKLADLYEVSTDYLLGRED